MNKEGALEELRQLTRVSLDFIDPTFDDDGLLDIESGSELSDADKAKVTAWVEAKGYKMQWYAQHITQNRAEGHSHKGFFIDMNKYTRKHFESMKLSRLVLIAQFWGHAIDTSKIKQEQVIDMLLAGVEKTKRKPAAPKKAVVKLDKSKEEKASPAPKAETGNAKVVGVSPDLRFEFDRLSELMRKGDLNIKGSKVVDLEIKGVEIKPYFNFKTEAGKWHGYFPNLVTKYVTGA